MTSPTQRALKDARDLGFTAQVVEKRVPFRNTTIDLFGCIDIVAIREGVGGLGIQATTGSHHANRRAKSIALPELLVWLKCGLRFEIWSYSKVNGGKRGGRKLWRLRREELVADGEAIVSKEVA